MKIEATGLYTHDDYGEVVVLGIHRVYGTYNPDSPTGENSELREVYVRFTEFWDDYGPMPGCTHTTPVEEFTTAIGEKEDTVEFPAFKETETPLD